MSFKDTVDKMIERVKQYQGEPGDICEDTFADLIELHDQIDILRLRVENWTAQEHGVYQQGTLQMPVEITLLVNEVRRGSWEWQILRGKEMVEESRYYYSSEDMARKDGETAVAEYVLTDFINARQS